MYITVSYRYYDGQCLSSHARAIRTNREDPYLQCRQCNIQRQANNQARSIGQQEEEEQDEEPEVIEDVEDDNINELDELDDEERTRVLRETAAVRATVTKVCHETEDVRLLTNKYMSAYLIYRSENFHLPSFSRRRSLSLLGVVSATS